MEKITTTGLRVRWHPVARPNCALLRVGHNIHRGTSLSGGPRKKPLHVSGPQQLRLLSWCRSPQRGGER